MATMISIDSTPKNPQATLAFHLRPGLAFDRPYPPCTIRREHS